MILEEFKAWVNSNIKPNATRAITGAIMNTFGHNIIETFAHIDNPLQPFTVTIEDADLTNLAITITHNKNTLVPDFILYDEAGIAVYSEMYTAEIVDSNNIKLTFYEAIPGTGNGYFKFLLWKIAYDVDPRYDLVYSNPFDNLDDLTITYGNQSATAEISTGTLVMTNYGAPAVFIVPDTFDPKNNRKYRIKVKIDQGDLLLKMKGFQPKQKVLASPGEYTVILKGSTDDFEFQSYSANVTVLDYLTIEEEV